MPLQGHPDGAAITADTITLGTPPLLDATTRMQHLLRLIDQQNMPQSINSKPPQSPREYVRSLSPVELEGLLDERSQIVERIDQLLARLLLVRSVITDTGHELANYDPMAVPVPDVIDEARRDLDRAIERDRRMSEGSR